LKQIIRLITNPAAFINQLQWSRNHAWILLTFLGLAIVESQIGTTKALNAQLSWLLANHTHMARDQAMFLVMVGRIAALFLGALLLTEVFWKIGARLGRASSKRVLQRRLSIVYTFLLGSYILATILNSDQQIWAGLVFGWGLLLAYVTFREHFNLDRFAAIVLGLVAVAAIVVSWQQADRFVQKTTSQAMAKHLAKAHPAHYRR
jgi:hypothetical protein